MGSDSDTLTEIRDLLIRVCRLLEPVADNYQEQYEAHERTRQEAREKEVRRLLSTPRRTKAWQLADGSRNIATIARDARLDQGGRKMLTGKVLPIIHED